MRYAGMGFEFAASLVVFMLVGYWVDYHWHIQSHWGTLIGTLLGLIGGTYNFVREAIKAVREVNQLGNGRRGSAPGSKTRPTGRDAGDSDRPGRDEAD